MSRGDFEDDGRTIADMSGIDRPSLFLPRSPKKSVPDRVSAPQNDDDRPWESSFTPEERRSTVLAALKAALLIAFAFIVGLGLVVLFLLWIWS